MFDRFVLASKYERIRERYDQASLPEGDVFLPSYNIAQGDYSYVVISEPTTNIQTSIMPTALQSFFHDKAPTRAIKSFQFGLNGVEKSTKYFIRSEGNRNASNDMYYTGSKAIFLDHRYKKIIRTQRSLVLADAFIINIDTNPHLMYLKDQKRPFGFAGLWNVIQDDNGLKMHSFGILTVPANPLLKRLGCDRMPVIVDERNERRWISKNTELSQVLGMLNVYPHHLMNAYPISDKIRDVSNNNLEVIQPIGSRVYNERFNMPSRKRAKTERPVFDSPTMGEVAKMGRK